MEKKIFDKKEKKASNTNKDSNLNVVLFIFLVVAVIYGIILVVRNTSEKPTPYNSSNIKEYINEQNLVKSDYFYSLDAEVANFLEAVDKEMYLELYQILIQGYNKIYSKGELTEILKEYKQNVFNYEGKNNLTKFDAHLLNAYSIDGNKYLLQLDFNNGEFYLILGNGRNKYNFTIVE